ncbi:ROK family protein [Sphingobacterium detergens]|uniref:Putative NBD/HSP70 family sugar kinase n=1 Tax=Sphingobacterium detergens TaxID=1145106 RepID=A0A420AG57_SPHD1|nr:ROK family protein [Sphingobacterium detergens]RKE43381.1 putative NBD/HSP70 family sugar kinase [Sphingobacterium detergens]
MTKAVNLLINKKLDSKPEKKNLFNKLSIIKLIAELGSVSVNDIVKNLSLSLPTVNSLIAELLEDNIVRQFDKGESIGGRKPNLYRLCDGLFQVLCIELQRFSITLSIMDNNQNIVAETVELDNELSRNADNLHDITRIIDQYLLEKSVDTENLTGLIISMPGLINAEEGTNETFLHDASQSITAYFENKYSKPVYILNDVKGAAYAELKFGLAKNTRNSLIILMDWGIGLGIVSNGEVYLGRDGYSGEVGHMPFIDNGELCYCGKRGCLETVASGIALVNNAKQEIQKGELTKLNELHKEELDHLTPTHVIEAANKGDQFAINQISKLGTNLGKAFASLIQLLNPELIVLGGKIAKANELITIPIQQAINSYTMAILKEHCDIKVSSLNLDSNTIGLTNYFITKYLSVELLQKSKI